MGKLTNEQKEKLFAEIGGRIKLNHMERKQLEWAFRDFGLLEPEENALAKARMIYENPEHDEQDLVDAYEQAIVDEKDSALQKLQARDNELAERDKKIDNLTSEISRLNREAWNDEDMKAIALWADKLPFPVRTIDFWLDERRRQKGAGA